MKEDEEPTNRLKMHCSAMKSDVDVGKGCRQSIRRSAEVCVEMEEEVDTDGWRWFLFSLARGSFFSKTGFAS